MMTARPPRSTPLLAGLLVLASLAVCPLAGAGAAPDQRFAQYQPPGGMPGADDQSDDNGGGGDASALLLRVGRLETDIRALRGRVEELQHQNELLQENLRKLSQDVDFRFQDLQGHGGGTAPQPRPAPVQRRSDAGAADPVTPTPVAPADTAGAANPPVYVPLKPTRTGDAFDPALDPSAPGAPRPLGTTPPSQPLPSRSTAALNGAAGRAPLDLMRSGAQPVDAPVADVGPAVIGAPAAARALPNQNSVASLAPGGTREEFDADLGLYKQGQYETAATGLQGFAEKYPRDRLVPEAVYLAGESYSRLGRHREAAEQFLKVSTDYAKSPRAPDALLRLGMSLDSLGAKEQACATFQEVNRKYPAASADVKASVDRELKRAHCRVDG